MRELKNIQGSKEAAKELIIGKDTVYIHSNIRKLEADDSNLLKKDTDLYAYDEIQMSKDEYLELLQEKVKTSAKAMAEMMIIIGRLGGEK